MKDEILEELWKSKDEIAEEHGYNMDKLVNTLREMEKERGIEIVDLSTIKKTVLNNNNS